MKGSSQHFNAFTTTFGGRANKLLTQLTISAAYDPHHPPSPPVQTHKVTALWDTGATGSVITQRVVKECSLQPTGMTKVNTASGETTSPVYLVNFGLRNNVGVAGLRVTEGIISDEIDVLIGMDIMNHGDFAVTNHNGKTTFTFRIPSLQTIDFVKYRYNPKIVK